MHLRAVKHLLTVNSCKIASCFIENTQRIIQVESMDNRLTQNDLKKEEADQALGHKDYYFLASVEFLKQSEERKKNCKYKTFADYDILVCFIPFNYKSFFTTSNF